MQINCDVLVVGSGSSGLINAILLAEKGLKVIVATKDAVTESSSIYAQGGIAVPLANSKSIESHIQDTLKVGKGEAKEEVVKHYISKISNCIETLSIWGVPFIGYKDGIIDQDLLTHEAAHSSRRVLKVGSDLSGRSLMKALLEKACRLQNLSISQGTTLLELSSHQEKCTGGSFQDINNNIFQITAKATVLATGGLGAIFQKTTNPWVSSGDGIAAANKIGAEIENLRYIQFHPTALEHPSHFLLSESLRGEGAHLLNKKGERFMQKYEPKELELAQRSVVSYAVWKEIQETGAVYLDARHLGNNFLKERFQGIYNKCYELGFDLTSEIIPITPAAHYSIGGLKVNLQSQTNINNLYAVGEVACTGMHGADRLASNSLLECIVSAFSAADSIINSTDANEKSLQNELNLEPLVSDDFEVNINLLEAELIKLKEMMWLYAAFDIKEEGLKTVLEFAAKLKEKLPQCLTHSPQVNLAKHQVSASILVLQDKLAHI
ncbi:MAG TPA: FAD-binding protein [Vampirovibrionales bacterium]